MQCRQQKGWRLVLERVDRIRELENGVDPVWTPVEHQTLQVRDRTTLSLPTAEGNDSERTNSPATC